MDPLGNAVHATSKCPLFNKTVLITGCGPIGLMMIRIAKQNGAHKVVATDISDFRLSLALDMHADIVLNADKMDIVEKIYQITNGIGIDVWIDGSGSEAGILQGFKAVSHGGCAVLLGLPKTSFPFDFSNDLIAKGITVHGVIGREIFNTWHNSLKLANDSRFVEDIRKIISHRFALEDFDLAFEKMIKKESGKIVFLL